MQQYPSNWKQCATCESIMEFISVICLAMTSFALGYSLGSKKD